MGDVFKALADSTRRDILLMLVESPCSIGEIAENFDMTRPAVAKHVKILKNANLLKIESDTSDGRQRNCLAQLEALTEVKQYMTQLEKFWTSKFKSLNTYLEKTK